MIRGKSVVVTGSTSGIGLGIAKTFAAAGARVTLNGLGDPSEIERLRAMIAAEHRTEVRYDNANLLEPVQIEGLIQRATEAFGRVDVLVNNAGMQHTARTEAFPVERWQMIMELNLSAVFHACRAALPQMYKRNWGRIINIASAHGLVASVEKSAYVASKHGVLGLTKVMALEAAKTGVTCNAICPGWVLTPLVERQIRDRAKNNGSDFDTEKRKLLEEKQPSGEFVTPEQIGEIALFLCSEGASQIRGQALPVDGGWTAQ